ncbi:transporter, partial [Pseudomonas aeruginosa]
STGIGATLGICTVGVFFSTISLLGLAALLHQYPAFSKVATLCGSAYLLYIAYSIIKSVLAKNTGTAESTAPGATSFAKAYRVGVITNISNMKTIAFMISIYAGFLSVPRSEIDKVLVVMLCSTLEVIWYSVVALLFGQGPIKALFLKYTRQIDVGLAVFLVAFSLNNAIPVLIASR